LCVGVVKHDRASTPHRRRVAERANTPHGGCVANRFTGTCCPSKQALLTEGVFPIEQAHIHTEEEKSYPTLAQQSRGETFVGVNRSVSAEFWISGVWTLLFCQRTSSAGRSVAADCSRSDSAGGLAGWLPSGQRSSVSSSERCVTIASFRPSIIIVLIRVFAGRPENKKGPKIGSDFPKNWPDAIMKKCH
jgi:hypothetical protein